MIAGTRTSIKLMAAMKSKYVLLYLRFEVSQCVMKPERLLNVTYARVVWSRWPRTCNSLTCFVHKQALFTVSHVVPVCREAWDHSYTVLILLLLTWITSLPLCKPDAFMRQASREVRFVARPDDCVQGRRSCYHFTCSFVHCLIISCCCRMRNLKHIYVPTPMKVS